MGRHPSGSFGGHEERTPTAAHIRIDELRARHTEQRQDIADLTLRVQALAETMREVTSDLRSLRGLVLWVLGTVGTAGITTIVTVLITR